MASSLWIFAAVRPPVSLGRGEIRQTYVLDAERLRGNTVTSFTLEPDRRLNPGMFEGTEGESVTSRLKGMCFALTNITLPGIEDEPHLKTFYWSILGCSSGSNLTVWDCDREGDVSRDLSSLEPGAQLLMSIRTSIGELPSQLVFRARESPSPCLRSE